MRSPPSDRSALALGDSETSRGRWPRCSGSQAAASCEHNLLGIGFGGSPGQAARRWPLQDSRPFSQKNAVSCLSQSLPDVVKWVPSARGARTRGVGPPKRQRETPECCQFE